MGYKSKKAKATNIPYKVKEAVWERDNHHCIYCGKTGYGVMSNAHFIPRSKGGLGIEQNVVTLCISCHRDYDQTTARAELGEIIKEYLQSKYENWNVDDLYYKKYDWQV